MIIFSNFSPSNEQLKKINFRSQLSNGFKVVSYRFFHVLFTVLFNSPWNSYNNSPPLHIPFPRSSKITREINRGFLIPSKYRILFHFIQTLVYTVSVIISILELVTLFTRPLNDEGWKEERGIHSLSNSSLQSKRTNHVCHA